MTGKSPLTAARDRRKPGTGRPIVSFSWTSRALVAGVKTATRRLWKDSYAARFHAGDLIDAYDRRPDFGGKPIAVLRLTEDVHVDADAGPPPGDFGAEGIPWLRDRGLCRPGLPRTEADFVAWTRADGPFYVVRFELVELTPHGVALRDGPAPAAAQGQLFD